MRRLFLALALSTVATQASAQAVPSAKEILMKSVAIPTVEGRGKVPELADYYAGVLKAAGYRDDELIFTPMGETGYFTATLKGRSSARPILLIGHMDVVEAKAADWARDPFVPVEEKGYIFGRGAEDNKYDVAMMVSTMARLKLEGFRPKQDIVLMLSGDEETSGTTTRAAAQKYRNADLALNGDAGGGLVTEDGKVLLIYMQAAEKTYADFKLVMTDPGGHSSTPTSTNPVYRMARALARLDAYRFTPMQNEMTRAALTLKAQTESGELKQAITDFLANPADTKAADIISSRPELIGQVRTTCIATMINGGHAENALPQSVTANINCRIFPGVKVSDVQATLEKTLAEPAMTLTAIGDPLPSDPSPLRPDLLKAHKAAVGKRFPGVPIVPVMSAGATDSIFFRTIGVPAYGVASLVLKESDSHAHGLDERSPVEGIPGALTYWYDLVTGLTK